MNRTATKRATDLRYAAKLMGKTVPQDGSPAKIRSAYIKVQQELIIHHWEQMSTTDQQRALNTMEALDQELAELRIALTENH